MHLFIALARGRKGESRFSRFSSRRDIAKTPTMFPLLLRIKGIQSRRMGNPPASKPPRRPCNPNSGRTHAHKGAGRCPNSSFAPSPLGARIFNTRQHFRFLKAWVCQQHLVHRVARTQITKDGIDGNSCAFDDGAAAADFRVDFNH
jgi:hypothetical protein